MLTEEDVKYLYWTWAEKTLSVNMKPEVQKGTHRNLI